MTWQHAAHTQQNLFACTDKTDIAILGVLCRYCAVHNPACVVKCMSTGKWFCNGRNTKAGSCIVVHLVKSKTKVQPTNP